jgi:hypothetical protein
VATWGVTLRWTAPRRRAFDFAQLRRARVALSLPSLPGGAATAPARPRAPEPPRPHKPRVEPARQVRAKAAAGSAWVPMSVTLTDAHRANALPTPAAGRRGLEPHQRKLLGSVFAPASEASAGDSGEGSTAGDGGNVGGSSDEAGSMEGGVEGGSIDETIGIGGFGLEGSGVGGGGGGGYARCGLLGGRHAGAPDVIAAAADVRPTCDASMIRRVVRAHVNEVRFCYERSLQADPALRGRVVARFTIAADGSVAGAADTSDSSVAQPAVADCIAGAVARWRFDPLCAGEVRYPFVLVPAGDDDL